MEWVRIREGGKHSTIAQAVTNKDLLMMMQCRLSITFPHPPKLVSGFHNQPVTKNFGRLGTSHLSTVQLPLVTQNRTGQNKARAPL